MKKSADTDGNEIRTTQRIPARKNQKLIITVLDEFVVEDVQDSEISSSRGTLSKYANPELWQAEDAAWQEAVIRSYGDA